MTVKTEWVTIAGAQAEFKGYLAIPEVTPAPALVVVPEIFGVNDHIQSVTRRFAEAGYLALAPDLFHQAQPGFVCGYTPEEIAHARELKGKINNDVAVEDIAATMGVLSKRPEAKPVAPAVVGFCWGGLMTYLAAARLEPSVAVYYYGSGIPAYLGEANQINCPILFHFGERDPSIPPEHIEQVVDAIQPLKEAHVEIYPEADHGFHCDMRASYHEHSARLAWERTLEFFGTHLPH